MSDDASATGHSHSNLDGIVIVTGTGLELETGTQTCDLKECDIEKIQPDKNASGMTFNANIDTDTSDAKKKKKKKKKKSTPTTNANQFCDDNTIASIEEIGLLYILKVDIIKALNESKGDIDDAIMELMNLSGLRELQEDQKLVTKMGSLVIKIDGRIARE
jgi:NACalpha-BTF3-like transcription factor